MPRSPTWIVNFGLTADLQVPSDARLLCDVVQLFEVVASVAALKAPAAGSRSLARTALQTRPADRVAAAVGVGFGE